MALIAEKDSKQNLGGLVTMKCIGLVINNF